VAPEGLDTRPTSDRVREAVFNALYSLGVLEGAHLVDLYAGSGAMGIEALSRGAARAVFVESSRDAVEAIRANLTAAGVEDRAEVVVGDVRRFLRSSEASFDLAIVDPPYSFADWEELLLELSAGLLVIESDRTIDVPEGWETHRVKRYGGTVVTIASSHLTGSDHSGSSPK
jgi:16S rRNA (guanine966-N2)-methyltransferase